MKIRWTELPPAVAGPTKPSECWHIDSSDEVPLRLTIEEGNPTLVHPECGLPVSLTEPADLELHEPIEVTARWHVEQGWSPDDYMAYLLLTPTESTGKVEP